MTKLEISLEERYSKKLGVDPTAKNSFKKLLKNILMKHVK